MPYMMLTTLTRPNSSSVNGCNNCKIQEASMDSVLLALMTSVFPFESVMVAIFLNCIYQPDKNQNNAMYFVNKKNCYVNVDCQFHTRNNY